MELSGISGEYWKLTIPGKSNEYYDQNGRLLRIEDLKSGLEHQFTYSGSQVIVTHTNGDSLTIQYDAPAAVTTVDNFVTTSFSAPPESIVTSYGQFDYEYNSASTRLESVSFTSNQPGSSPIQQRQYQYEDPIHPLYYTTELDARNRVISSVSYHPDGKVASSQKGLTGETHSFEYPSYAQRTVTNSFGLETDYVFQVVPPRNLLEIRGEQTSTCQSTSNKFVYDTKGRKIGAINVNDSNRGKTFTYNSDNLITSVTEGGRLNGMTPVVTNVEARQKSYTYNHVGQIKSVTAHYRDGGSSTANWIEFTQTVYTYWPNTRIKSKTQTDLSNETNPFGSTNGQTRTTTYDYTYHSGQNIPTDTLVDTLTIDGPLPGSSDTTTFTYDIQGRLTQSTNAEGHDTQYRDFNAHGQPETIEDGNGTITSLTYHPLGWIESVKVEEPSGQSNLDSEITYSWYDNGTLEQVTYPDGSYLHYEYNDARHITTVTNNLGETTTYTPNAMGDWTHMETKDSSDNITQLQDRIFDDLGRLRELLGNYGQRTIYFHDFKDNLYQIQERGAFTARTTNYYDTLNRLNRVLQPRRTEVNGQLTSINHNTYYAYNIQDRVTSVTDPNGNITTYIYNGFGEKITQISPDTGTTHYWYNEQGNMTFKQDARGVIVQYHYDDLGRLTWVQYPEIAEDVHYYYDEVTPTNPYALGKLTRITDQSGSTLYEYDHRGNLILNTRVIEDQTYSTGYDYNLANKLTQVTYPSGRLVNYYRNDPLGRISAVTTQDSSTAPEQNVITGVQYLPFGPIDQYTYGNGLVRDIPHDLDYRLDMIQITDTQQSVMDLDYSYDAFNNIQGIQDNLIANRSQTFTYDDLHRLQHAWGDYGTNTDHIRYEYDPVGNRTVKELALGSVAHTTETYSYNPLNNQLDDVVLDTGPGQSTRSLSYNNAGALENETTLAGQARQYTYNDNLRLIELSTDNTLTGDYLHNALGQRIRKVSAQGTEHFHYDQSGLLLASSNGQGVALQEHIYLEGEPIAVVINDEAGSSQDIDVDLNSTSPFTTQDTNSGSVQASTDSITLTGNRWRYIDGAVYTLTANTVSEFEFSADSLGEVQAIAFDNDHAVNNGEIVFKLAGTQNWGNQDYQYTGNGAVQSFSIPVGQFLTGDNWQLLIINDQDASPETSTLTISNVRLCETSCVPAPDPEPEPSYLDLISTTPFTNQDSSSGSVLANATSLTLNGNRWRYIDSGIVDLTPNTILEFDFSSDSLGEVQGVAFDNDTVIDNGGAVFKLAGWQNWGVQSYSYTGNGAVQSFSIPVGQYLTGSGWQLLIINDNDAAPNDSTLTISNVRICETTCGGAAQ